MKAEAQKATQANQSLANAHPVSQQPTAQKASFECPRTEPLEFEDNRPASVAQPTTQEMIGNSPRMVAQRRRLERAFGLTEYEQPTPEATRPLPENAQALQTQNPQIETGLGSAAKPDTTLALEGTMPSPEVLQAQRGRHDVQRPIIQRVKFGNLTLGILGTIVSIGLIWCSPGFRRFMSDAWHDDEYREKLQANDFRIGAGLEQYKQAFGSGFESEIMNLGEDERWLDGGAGVGQAIKDYYGRGGKAQTTAVGFQKPESEVVSDLEKMENFEYLSGKFFSEFDDERELRTGAKKVRVITDYNGILSYTRTLSQDLQKYLNNLQVDGTLFTFFYATINDGAVSEVAWLNQIKGVTVATHDRTFAITKTQEETVVPPLKLLEHKPVKNTNIPSRKYSLG